MFLLRSKKHYPIIITQYSYTTSGTYENNFSEAFLMSTQDVVYWEKKKYKYIVVEKKKKKKKKKKKRWIKSNRSGSSIFRTMEICSGYGQFKPLKVNHSARLGHIGDWYMDVISIFYEIMVCWVYTFESPLMSTLYIFMIK